MLAQINEAVEAFAVNERFEVAAYQNVRSWFAGFEVARDTDGVLGARGALIADICGEGQHLLITCAADFEIYRNEGRIIDGDADFFDRGDEKIIVAVFAQDC